MTPPPCLVWTMAQRTHFPGRSPLPPLIVAEMLNLNVPLYQSCEVVRRITPANLNCSRNAESEAPAPLSTVVESPGKSPLPPLSVAEMLNLKHEPLPLCSKL